MDSFDIMIQKSYTYQDVLYRGDPHWTLLKELFERNYVKGEGGNSAGIPKVIHQIWLGSAFPEKYRAWANSWKKYNPDWEYRLWTDADVDDLDVKCRAVYDSISNYGAKSDILRYHILNMYGGVYVDTDFECVKSLDDLVRFDFITGIGYSPSVELYVGFIASTPHHPIMQRVVSSITHNITNDAILKNILKATSSYFFTENFFKVMDTYKERVITLPPDYLYPFPNAKGHRLKDGTKYVKKCSYAIHHWATSWAVGIGGRDWIQGDRFKELANFTYSPSVKAKDDYDNLPNTFNPVSLKDGINIVYTHTMYAKQLIRIIKHLPKDFILITHNSDVNVDDSFEIPDNVIHWFAQNVAMDHPKLESIPIGLENDRWKRGKVGKQMMIVDQVKKEQKYKNLVYLNCNPKTNPDKRLPLFTIFYEVPWVTIEQPNLPLAQYIEQVYSHKFILCPEGNGIDTHRLWESIYLNVIPIVKRCSNTIQYDDLPICFVDSWKEVTEEFLNKEFERIKGQQWNLARTNFTYWRSRIQNYQYA